MAEERETLPRSVARCQGCPDMRFCGICRYWARVPKAAQDGLRWAASARAGGFHVVQHPCIAKSLMIVDNEPEGGVAEPIRRTTGKVILAGSK
jgi:hypothetical protein